MLTTPANPPGLSDSEAASLQLAMDLRERAIDEVEAHADEDWLDRAEVVIRSVAPGATFVADYVWDALDAMAIPRPREPRALGAVFRRLKNAGEIEHTQTYVRSIRKDNHGRPVPIWRRR